jgi:hypothetical protein
MPELGFIPGIAGRCLPAQSSGQNFAEAFNWDAGKRLGAELITFCLGLFKITAPRATASNKSHGTIFAASSDTSTTSAHLPSLVRIPPNHASTISRIIEDPILFNGHSPYHRKPALTTAPPL